MSGPRQKTWMYSLKSCEKEKKNNNTAKPHPVKGNQEPRGALRHYHIYLEGCTSPPARRRWRYHVAIPRPPYHHRLRLPSARPQRCTRNETAPSANHRTAPRAPGDGTRAAEAAAGCSTGGSCYRPRTPQRGQAGCAGGADADEGDRAGWDTRHGDGAHGAVSPRRRLQHCHRDFHGRSADGGPARALRRAATPEKGA